MTGSVPPPNPLSYEGQVSLPYLLREFAPNPSNLRFPCPCLWIDTLNETAYLLVNKALGTAEWIELGNAVGTVSTLTGDTGGPIAPILDNITIVGGTGVSVTGNPLTATLTIDVNPGIGDWVEVTSATQAMSPDIGYIINYGSLCTLTLPATCLQGTTYSVAGKGVGGWLIAQNAGQKIYFGNVSTSTGIGGSLASSHQRDVITLVCITANTEFEVVACQGNITYV